MSVVSPPTVETLACSGAGGRVRGSGTLLLQTYPPGCSAREQQVASPCALRGAQHETRHSLLPCARRAICAHRAPGGAASDSSFQHTPRRLRARRLHGEQHQTPDPLLLCARRARENTASGSIASLLSKLRYLPSYPSYQNLDIFPLIRYLPSYRCRRACKRA